MSFYGAPHSYVNLTLAFFMTCPWKMVGSRFGQAYFRCFYKPSVLKTGFPSLIRLCYTPVRGYSTYSFLAERQKCGAGGGRVGARFRPITESSVAGTHTSWETYSVVACTSQDSEQELTRLESPPTVKARLCRSEVSGVR